MLTREEIRHFRHCGYLKLDGALPPVLVAGLKETIVADIARMFPGSVEWTLNDAWYLELRDRMARSIVDLKHRLAGR